MLFSVLAAVTLEFEMPLGLVSEAFVRGQSLHSAHSSVQSVQSTILYPGYNETFGFPSPPRR